MKNLLFIALVLTCISGTAQSDTLPVIACPVYQMPSFPGGEETMRKFIIENLKYPKKEKEENITGQCTITFVVEKDGSLSDIKVKSGIPDGPGLDEEAMRVVGSMPNWIPGRQDGQIVRVQFNLPIKFSLQAKKKRR